MCRTQVQPLTRSQVALRRDSEGSPPGPLGQDHCRERTPSCTESCWQPSTSNSEEKSENQAFPGENEDTGFLRLVLLQTCLYLGFHMIKKQQDVRLSGL